MRSLKKTVLACGSFLPFEDNLRQAHPDHTFLFLPVELHADPSAFRHTIEKTLSSLTGEVYLLFAGCAYPLIGMEVSCDLLHLYKAQDCFSMLSATQERYGSYFITQGLALSDGRPSKRFASVLQEQGSERAFLYMKTVYASIERIIVLSGFEAAKKEALFLSKLLSVPIVYQMVDLTSLHAYLNGENTIKDVCLKKGERVHARCFLRQGERLPTV